MATVTRENKELKRSHDELKRDFDTILSVVSTELSLLDIPPNDKKPMDGIRTVLTSLTSMIQPDCRAYCVHMSNILGLFRDPELKSFSNILRASSPPLCILPGFKIYLAFGNDCVSKRFFLLLEKSAIHGYPETVSIEVQPTTGQPFSCSLKDLQHSCDIQRDSGREVRVMMGDILPNLVSDDFYANIRITDISYRAETT